MAKKNIGNYVVWGFFLGLVISFAIRQGFSIKSWDILVYGAVIGALLGVLLDYSRKEV